MYNGIGLTTPRGSGTNGHVQRNWAFVRPGKKDNSNFATEEDIKKSEARLNRPPNKDILDHDRKRKIEVKCIEFEEILEKQGRSADEIKKKVDSYREKLLSQTKSDLPKDEFGRVSVRETHQLAEAQLEKNIKLREAFNIPQYFVDGSSFDSDKKEKEALLKSAALQKELELQRSAMTSAEEDSKRRYAMVRTPSKERDDNTEKDHRTSSKSEKKKKRKRARDSSLGSPERKKDKKKKSKKNKKESKKKASRKRKISETSLNESDNHSEMNSDLDSKKARKKAKKEKRKQEKISKKDESPVKEARARKLNKERSSNSKRNNPFRNDEPVRNNSSRTRDSPRSRKRTRSHSFESPERKRSRSLDSHKRWSEKSKRSPSERARRSERRIDKRRSKSMERADKRRSKSIEKSSKNSHRSSEEQRNSKQRIRSSRGYDRDKSSDRTRRMSADRRSRDRSEGSKSKISRDIKEVRVSPHRHHSRSRSLDRSRGKTYRRRPYTRSHSRSRSRSRTRTPSRSSRDIYKHRSELPRKQTVHNPFKINVERNQRETTPKTPVIPIETKHPRSNSEKSNKKRSSSISDQDAGSGKYEKNSDEIERNRGDIYDKRREHSNDAGKKSNQRKSSRDHDALKTSECKTKATNLHSLRRSLSESRTPPYRRKSTSSSSDQEAKSEKSEQYSGSPPIPKASLRNQCTAPPITSSHSNRSVSRCGSSKEIRKSAENSSPITPPLLKSTSGMAIDESNMNSNSNSSDLSYSPARKNPDRYKEILQSSSPEKKKKDKSPVPQTSKNMHIKDCEKKSHVRYSRDHVRSKISHHAPAACLQSNSSESDEEDVNTRNVDRETSALEEFQAPKRNVAIGEMAMLQQLAAKAREKIKSKEQLERQNQSQISSESNTNKRSAEQRSKEYENHSFQVSDKVVVNQRSVRNSLSDFLAANNARALNTITANAIDLLSSERSEVIASITTVETYPEPLETAQPTDNPTEMDTSTLIECQEPSNTEANDQGEKSPTEKPRASSTDILLTNIESSKKPTTTPVQEHTPERKYHYNNNSNNLRENKTPPLIMRKSSYQRLNYHSNRPNSNISNGGGVGIPMLTSSSSSSKYSLNNIANKTVLAAAAARKSGAFTSSNHVYHNRSISRVNSNQFASIAPGHFPNNQIISNKNYANGNPIIIGRREHQRQYHHYRSSNPHFANNHPLNTANAFCSNNILLTTNNGNNSNNNSHHHNHHHTNNNGSNCQANSCSSSHYHRSHSNSSSNNSSNQTYQHHRSHHKDGHSHSHHNHHHHHSHQSHHRSSVGNQLISDPMLVASSLSAVVTGRNHPYPYHFANHGAINVASNSAVVANQSNYAVAAVAAAAAASSSSLSYHHQQKQKIVIKPFKIHDPQPLASALADSALVDTIVSKVSTATVAAAAAAERERRSHSRPRRSRSTSRNGDRDRNDKVDDDAGSHRSSSHSDYSRSSSSSSRFGSRSHSSKYRSRSASQSSESSNSSNSSSNSSHSSASSRTGSRSPSIPRRRGSPSFLDRRRITSKSTRARDSKIVKKSNKS